MPSDLFRGASGLRHAGRSRTARQRMDDSPAAIERGKELLERIEAAAGDAGVLADRMAEAIGLWREARGMSRVGRDGRTIFGIEELYAALCCDKARELYLVASGANHG